MTVAELIKHLSEMPQHYPVVIHHDHSGYADAIAKIHTWHGIYSLNDLCQSVGECVVLSIPQGRIT